MQENKIVITDSSCFILLDNINALQLLPLLFEFVVTTPEVAKECGDCLPDWVIIQGVANKVRQKEFDLIVDPGEASAIALAFEISPTYLILDDRKGRKLAKKLGLPIKGTVGILLLAKFQGLIPAIRPYIDLIRKTNFRLSEDFIADILDSADE